VGISGHFISGKLKQIKVGYFQSKIDRNFTFRLLMHGVTASQPSILYGTSTPAHACLMMGSTGSTRLGCGRKGGEYVSCSVNKFSFLHQLSNEHADGTVADDITHWIYTYNIFIIHAFLLLIEQQMCGRVNFPRDEILFFDSNSAARRAIGLYALLSHSFTLYYFALE
jgi:hypothetical protein